ncbi:MAG: hypothetical protein HKN68_05460 [Saprospiraceae bacterium]|nr:hypothetical protein [Saprospiraceae bacterium]
MAISPISKIQSNLNRHHLLPVQLITILLLLIYSLKVEATHVFGVQITYECLNDTDKRIYLKAYRDCDGAANTINYNITFQHVSGPMDLPVPLGPNSPFVINEIPSTCPAVNTQCTDVMSSLTGIEEHLSYRDYSFTPGSVWIVSYNTCCLSGDFTNGSANQGIYVESLIDNTIVPCNSSPQFTNRERFQSCVNEIVTYSVNAYDPDGDSLRYSLVDCLSSAGVPVTYNGGLSGTNPMSTAPGMEWTIDPLSGQITGQPNMEQTGLICVKVEEFRNNVKIGEIVREIGFFVTTCANLSPTISAPFDFTTTAGEEICIDITAVDQDVADIISLSNPSGKGLLQNETGSNPINAQLCWTPTINDIGVQYFPIEATDDACPYLGNNTYIYKVTVNPPPVLEIFEIQGSGLTSPYEGDLVTTVNNVVTALSTDGFFIQTPSSRDDADESTSNGIFVFTGGLPLFNVGDLVDVTGSIEEFFGFTRFTSVSSVNVVGVDVVPAPVMLNSMIPSSDPGSPTCGINNFECLEGMYVEIVEGTVTGPNQRFNPDPIAETYIVATTSRTYIEPGIEFPGLPGLPVWDGNPEVFELDPDRLGFPNRAINAGSTFQAKGVIGFEFGGYELWPIELTITDNSLPKPIRQRNNGEATLATLDLFRLFDDVDDPPSMDIQGNSRNDIVESTADYQRRLKKLADYILNVLDAPDLLAVQEAEKIEVLQDLAAEISSLDPGVSYTAYLEEGNDLGTIDIGFMVRPSIQVNNLTQLGNDETFIDPEDNSIDVLHDRPPLLLEGTFKSNNIPFAALGVHNRPRSGIETSERVRTKRLLQAQSIAQMAQDYQLSKQPYAYLTVLGDFNATEFTDGYVDVLGQITGEIDPNMNLLNGPDLVDHSY